LEKRGTHFEIRLKLEKMVKLGKNGCTFKNGWHLGKWLTLGKIGHLEKWETFGKMGHTWKSE